MKYADFTKTLSDDLEGLFAHYASELEKIAVKWGSSEEPQGASPQEEPVMAQAVGSRQPPSQQPPSQQVPSAPASAPASPAPVQSGPDLGRKGFGDYSNYLKAMLGRAFRRESTESRKLTIVEYLRARKTLEQITERSLLEYKSRSTFPIRKLAGEFLDRMKMDVMDIVMKHVKRGMEAGVLGVGPEKEQQPEKEPDVAPEAPTQGELSQRSQTSDDWDDPQPEEKPDDSMYARHLAKQHPNVPPEDLEIVSQNFKRKGDKYAIKRDPNTIASVFLWLTRQGVDMVDEDNNFNYSNVWKRLNQAMGGDWGGGALYFNDLVKKNGPRAVRILQSRIRESGGALARMSEDDAARWVIALGEEAGTEGGKEKRAALKKAKEAEAKKEAQRLRRNELARARTAAKRGQKLTSDAPLSGKRKRR